MSALGFDTPTAEPEKTHIAKELEHKAPLIGCRFDPTGRFVFANSEDRTIQRFALDDGKAVGLAGHDGWVLALGFSPDGQTLYSGGTDGVLAAWPAGEPAPTPSRRVEAHKGWLRTLAVSPDGKTIATAGNDRLVRLWSAAEGSLLLELPAHERPVYHIGFSPGGKSLVTADLKGNIIEWDMRPGKEARRLDAAKLYSYNGGQGVDYGGVRDFSFSADGKLLACCGLMEASNPLGAVQNPVVVLFDWAEGKEILLQKPKGDVKGIAWGVRFHPSGFVIAVTGSGENALIFWKPDQANEFHKFALPNTGRGLDLHPDGLRLATAHHDGKLRISLMAAKVG